jgi:uncharacterized protein YndB with AHSA1/START domain
MRWLDRVLPVAHTVSRSAEVSAPPERVWAALTDVPAFPTWRPGVVGVEGQLPTWRERGRHGAIAYQATTVEAPTHLIVRIADTSLPYGGEWDYTVAAAGSGSRVTIVERGEVYNLVFRFMSRYVIGHTATIDTFLRSLSRYLNGR